MSNRRERLPVQVDPFRLAEAGRLLEGGIPLVQFKRLVPLLASENGAVQVELEFGVDNMGLPNLTGRIQVELQVLCQRCMQPMTWQVDNRIALAFIRQETDEDSIPGQYEPYLVESVPIHLNDVIEDELILTLPQIPRHPLAECPARDWVKDKQPADAETQTPAGSQPDNPFNVLAKLKTPNKGK